EGALHAFDAAIDVFFGGLGETCGGRFVADDPLVNEAVQNVGVGLRLAVEEGLIAAELPDVAEQDDVGFHFGDYAIDYLLRRGVARPTNRNHKHQQSRKCDPTAHQKLDPRLKKIWNFRRCVPCWQKAVLFSQGMTNSAGLS